MVLGTLSFLFCFFWLVLGQECMEWFCLADLLILSMLYWGLCELWLRQFLMRLFFLFLFFFFVFFSFRIVLLIFLFFSLFFFILP
jgi:hypothetical protein